MAYPVLTNEEMTESQRYNCFTRNGGNAIPKHDGPGAKGSNPATGLSLLWAHNPFRGNFNHWQVSRKEAGQILTCSRMKLPVQLSNIAVCVTKTKRRQKSRILSQSSSLIPPCASFWMDRPPCCVVYHSLPLEHNCGHLTYIKLTYFIWNCL